MTAPALATGPDAGRLEASDPATGASLGSVAVTAPAAVPGVVASAAQVQPLWAALRPEDRARYLRRAAQAVVDEFDELTQVLAREQGRPPVEVAVVELLPAIEALRWMAGAAPGILGDARTGVHRGLFPLKRVRLHREPLGVIGIVGARGAPFAQPLAQVAAGLVAGNGVVIKPAPGACLAGERIGRLLGRAGLPEGLVRVVHGGPDTGRALIEADVGAVFFTGRAGTGVEVRRACAIAGKAAVVETGGGDAMLVLGDARLSRAVGGAAWAAFAAAGQARGSVDRVYVVREVAERFIADLARLASGLRVGDPRDPGTQIGPLPGSDRLGHVDGLVEEALAAGATRHCGGPVEVPGLSGSFYRPTVISGLEPTMRLAREPIGGPVVAVATVDSTVDAIARANAAAHGLAASVWTSDRHQAERIARELRVGAVWLNDHLISPAVPQGPWGSRDRGPGRSHGETGVRACSHEKLVSWDPPGGRAPWWFAYDAVLERAAGSFARLGSARDADRQRGLREGTLPLLRVGLRALRGLRDS